MDREREKPILTECVYGTAVEPLRHPFGFKGGYLSELWQTVCRIGLSNGMVGVGVGVQSVLWADADVFCSHTQQKGNELMRQVTAFALRRLKRSRFAYPGQLLKAVFPAVHAYAAAITGKPDLCETFTLNSLVAVDLALWQLWAQINRQRSFDRLFASRCPSLGGKENALGCIPLISYQSTEQEIESLLENGAFLLKIKIGSNPDGRNNPDEMIRWDANRVLQIHSIADRFSTRWTECGKPVYYLDANGRYQTKDDLMVFLEKLKDSGVLSRVLLLEEPFASNRIQRVDDLPVRVAADESAHSAQATEYLIARYGYRAVALKPIAKTLSVTLDIVNVAEKHGIPCFCADLTVPPVMLDWNMQVAARLPRLPGLLCGIVESNGRQNYSDWDRLQTLTPVARAPWLTETGGIYPLGEDFYRTAMALRPPMAYAAAAVHSV